VSGEGAARLGWRAYLLLLLTALALYLPGRASLPPVDRDEARYLQATRQMMASGDYVDIRFQDQPRNLQPAGVYWLEAAAVKLFAGGNDRAVWAYRIPSLVAAILAVVLTARLCAGLFGPTAGLAAGLLLAASTLLGFEARMAKIDACLLAAVLVAQSALIHAYLGRVRGAGRLNALGFWIATGIGLLLKGPIILIVSGTTVLALWAMDRRAGWLKRLHAGWGALVAVAIAAPWFVAIGLRTHGAFFHKAVAQNLLGKIGRGEQHHGQPPGYYLAIANLTFWPGALAAAFAAPWAWRARGRPEVRALIAWIVPTWLIYEAIGTKLPHYVLPLYPAVACLAAGAATTAEGWRTGRFTRVAAWLYGAVWLLVSLALAAAGSLLCWRFGHGLDPVALGAGLVVAALAAATLWLVQAGARGVALTTGVMAAVALNAEVYGYVLPRQTPLWLGRSIAAVAAGLAPCPTSVLASTRFTEPSLVFADRGRVRMIEPRGAADLIAHDPRCTMAVVGADQLAAFRARAAADGVTLAPRGGLDGFDYSTGRTRALSFWTASEAPPPAPPGSD
jgi:4-amino-4-deoxy-L-arabinose transferase-like glycosyltransferase